MICLLLWEVLQKLGKGHSKYLMIKGPHHSNVIPSTVETPETHLKVATERGSTQVESPRRIERTREASQEDAIASTRHFFCCSQWTKYNYNRIACRDCN